MIDIKDIKEVAMNDMYKLDPNGYYVIKMPKDWSPKTIGYYINNIFPNFNSPNSPKFIILFDDMRMIKISSEVKKEENNEN